MRFAIDDRPFGHVQTAGGALTLARPRRVLRVADRGLRGAAAFAAIGEDAVFPVAFRVFDREEALFSRRARIWDVSAKARMLWRRGRLKQRRVRGRRGVPVGEFEGLSFELSESVVAAGVVRRVPRRGRARAQRGEQSRCADVGSRQAWHRVLRVFPEVLGEQAPIAVRLGSGERRQLEGEHVVHHRGREARFEAGNVDEVDRRDGAGVGILQGDVGVGRLAHGEQVLGLQGGHVEGLGPDDDGAASGGNSVPADLGEQNALAFDGEGVSSGGEVLHGRVGR